MFASKAATLILAQVFILLGFLIAVLTVTTFYFKKKAENAASHTAETPSENKDTSKTSNKNPQDITDSKANDTWKLRQFIEEELKACSDIYTSLSGNHIPDSIPQKPEKKLIAILIRQTYLKAELDAIESRNDPGPFWKIMTPELLKICTTLPSNIVKKTIRDLKDQLDTHQKENKHLHGIEATFFALQKLLRDSFSSNINELFLPLAEEIELLNADKPSDEIIPHYSQAFASLSDNTKQETTPENSSDSHTDTDIQSLNQITEDQAKNVKVISGFITELQEQNTLPSKQMEEYHNFLINMKKQVDESAVFISSLIRKLGESEMCSQFLESELAAAQEAIKTLMENIESDEAEKDNDRIEDLNKLVGKFALESRDMMQSIQVLQDENKRLRDQLDADDEEIMDGEGL